MLFVRTFLLFTILGMVLQSVSYAQENGNSDQYLRAEKKNCPANPDEDTIKALIKSYMKSLSLGHLRADVAKQSCLDKKTPYRAVVPTDTYYDNSPLPDLLFINEHSIKSLRKLQSSSFSDDYMVDMEITGEDKDGKPVKIKKEVLFVIKKGLEAKLYGCVGIHAEFEKTIISKECYKTSK